MNMWAVLHEVPDHPQHDKDLQLPVAEQGVALRQLFEHMGLVRRGKRGKWHPERLD